MEISPDPGARILIVPDGEPGHTPAIIGTVISGSLISAAAAAETLTPGDTARVFAQLDSVQTMVAPAEVMGRRGDLSFLRVTGGWSLSGSKAAPRFVTSLDATIAPAPGSTLRMAARVRDISIMGASVECLGDAPEKGEIGLTIRHEGRSATFEVTLVKVLAVDPAVLQCLFRRDLRGHQLVFLRGILSLLADERGWSLKSA
jgi:hypothetical protein